MRLREMKDLLEKNIDKLYVAQVDAGSHNYELLEYRTFIDAVDELSVLNYLNEEINSLKNYRHVYFNKSSVPNIIVDGNTLNNVKTIIDKIRDKSKAVYEAIDQALPNQNEHSVSIMLPPAYEKLDEVTEFFEELEKALKLGLKNDTIKVQAFDSGSFWVELIVNNQDTLGFLGSIITAATTGVKIYLENKRTKQHISSLSPDPEISNTLDEQVTALMKQRLESFIKAEAATLSDQYPERNIDTEYLVHIEKSILTMVKLLGEGTKVIPALNAPKEAVEQFPGEEVSKEIENQVAKFLTQQNQKQIESSKEEPDSEETDNAESDSE
ncbi:hypothetical protein JMN23_16835 [Bacillus sp. RHFB]|nr:hypothetical protein [Bacillus sp. RHFB]